MQQAKVLVQHATGLHARPAALFVKLAKQYKSAVTLSSKGITVNAKSMVLVLTLAVGQGSEVEITTDGEDEQDALTALTHLITANFEE
jgi:phosphocarrier protein